MDCVLMTQQMQSGRNSLRVTPTCISPFWMSDLARYVRSQPLLVKSGGTSEFLTHTYHSKPIGQPISPVLSVRQTYHSKPMGRPGFPILATRGSLIPV
jgi:hypothetical protein